ncbi:MAG: alkaline phosphatase D family protein [Pirellulaceae bacterium]|jgi:alkaline phosphatase/alkaline phosphatase D|nr:alkaline phosphatase D family protein [Pirellulaceae bacterium]MDP7020556.1 alkaline phosphatase D family protein [Pirellulaceae bacterium]
MNTTRLSNQFVICAALVLWCAASAALSYAEEIYRAQGEMTGEVTSNSAIVQTRLTSVDRNVDGDVPGAVGVARFEYGVDRRFRSSQMTPWQSSRAATDYIVKTVLKGLQPGARYYYRVHYGPSREQTQVGPVCTFQTLQGAEGTDAVSFVVVTGMMYGYFHGLDREEKGPRADRADGYPALKTMLDMELDFFVGTGDNVYYDTQPRSAFATTLPQLRRKWHEQFVQSRFVELYRKVPTYWEKDDHDHRYNDCDTAGNRAPSNELGIATFREQVPVVDPTDPQAKTYRTYRVNRDLQIWLVEGRDYRSPNKMPDGPEKTLWGAEQLGWLKRTLLASDATFKLLISPTPLVGPDDAYKIDNHTNPKGFRHEGREFFKWIVQHRLHEQGFYTVCGDRHWQYHSRDPLGVEEFSSGALVDENSRLGRKPGDPKSTDPNAEVVQLYTQSQKSGGFLRITVRPGTEAETGVARFTFVDDLGKVLYETEKVRPAKLP